MGTIKPGGSSHKAQSLCVRLPVIAFSALLLTLPLSGTVNGQEVSRLEIRKAMPGVGTSGLTAVEIYLPMALDGFNVENPLDTALTRLEKFADDRGTDLLAQHKIRKQANEERGFPAPDPITFAGVGDWGNDRDIKLLINVVDTPSSGATGLQITGDVVLNFAAEGEPSQLQVEGVPVDMGYDAQGVDTPIGRLVIQDGGSASRDEVTWHKFLVSSPDSAIVDVTVVGGDDSADVPFMSLEPSEFVFREPPTTVNLDIRYLGQRKVHVPLDLTLSLGL